jgi:hypothetical protein
VQIDAADGERIGCRPNLGFAIRIHQLPGAAVICRCKAKQVGICNGGARSVGSGLRRQPAQDRALAVSQHDFQALGQIFGLLLHEPVQIERSQEDELQLLRRIARRIGDLQHSAAGQSAERRLYDHGAGGVEGALEVIAIT